MNMWVGWFPLIILGIGILVFYFHKVGSEIFSREGIGSIYFRWIVEVVVFFAIALGSAVVMFFFLGDMITIILVLFGVLIFTGYIVSRYIQIRRFLSSQSVSDNYGELSSQVRAYKQFFIMLLVMFVSVLIISLISSIYLFSL